MEKTKIWSKIDNIQLINADFLKVNIPDNSIDLIVTFPPYNVGIRYNSHNDTISYDDYLKWTEKWLKKAFQLIKYDRRMCLNIPYVIAPVETIEKVKHFKEIVNDIMKLCREEC